MYPKNLCLLAGIAASSLFQLPSANGFSISQATLTSSTAKSINTQLHALIEAEEDTDASVDAGAGGIQLAQESVILITGSIDKKGSAVAKDLKRYTKLTTLSSVDEGSIICKGSGVENYVDPGMSTTKDITLAPLDAAGNALKNISGSASGDDVRINFAGGDDLMIQEVLEAAEHVAAGLNLSGGKVTFNSMCHESFPMEKCSVTVVNAKGDSDVYYHEGQWWTVSEDDINKTDA